MDTSATAMHDQMCGSWIKAGPVAPLSSQYWSFYDTPNADAAVHHAEEALYSSSRLSSTDMGKFYTSCQHTMLGGSGAIRASAKQAYAHLKAGLTALTSQQRVLEATGWIASHHCDSPVQIGVTVDGGSFKATSMRGSQFDTGALAEALYALDEPIAMQNEAETGNRLVTANAMSSPMASLQQMEYVFEGATERTDHANVWLLMGQTPELDGLVWLTSGGYWTEARAYLHGVAAMCAFALQGSMDIDAAADYSTAHRGLRTVRDARPRGAALGRLHTDNSEPQLTSDPTNETVASASSITMSALQSSPQGDPQKDCPALAGFLFPDRLDQEHFSMVVTNKLYDRLEELTTVLREAVAHVVVNNPNVSASLADPDQVASTVRNTRQRIAGAPRGTWAGIARDYSDGNLDSTDGPMLMALKQSKAIFTDRINILFDDANPCAGPPVYDALEANAYIYPSLACTHMMLGILRKPFADERYDNASLASRVGYVIAHEFAHNTLNGGWSTVGPMATLLSRYHPSLWSEAIADYVSAIAIVHAGLATGAEVCRHVSQIWCARVPLTWQPSTGTHPGANERGDLLCQTLADHGFM